MTGEEANAWIKSIRSSSAHWSIDIIHNGEGVRNLLAFDGKENGHFLLIYQNGDLVVGNYTDAVPHIGEAIFETIVHEKCGDMERAKRRVNALFGAGFIGALKA